LTYRPAGGRTRQGVGPGYWFFWSNKSVRSRPGRPANTVPPDDVSRPALVRPPAAPSPPAASAGPTSTCPSPATRRGRVGAARVKAPLVELKTGGSRTLSNDALGSAAQLTAHRDNVDDPSMSGRVKEGQMTLRFFGPTLDSSGGGRRGRLERRTERSTSQPERSDNFHQENSPWRTIRPYSSTPTFSAQWSAPPPR
jgi:hypothetical protein